MSNLKDEKRHSLISSKTLQELEFNSFPSNRNWFERTFSPLSSSSLRASIIVLLMKMWQINFVWKNLRYYVNKIFPSVRMIIICYKILNGRI